MKRIFPIHLFCLSGVALVLGACTSEVTDGGNTPADGPVPISFQTPETRAAKDGFGAGDAFSVWGWYADDAAGTNPRQVFNAEEVTNGGNNSWSYDGTQYWIAGKTYDFYAVYPTTVTATVSPDGTIKVDDFDASQTGADAVDLMTASATGMKGDSPQMVGLRFGHELTRIAFAVKMSDDMPVGYKVNVHTLSFVAYGRGDMERANGVEAQWVFEDNDWKNFQLDDKLQNNTDITATGTSNNAVVITSADLLMIPQTINQQHKVRMNYTLDNGKPADDPAYQYINNTIDIPLTNASLPSWQAGEALTYTIIISRQNVTVVLSVGDWEDGNAGNEDVVME